MALIIPTFAHIKDRIFIPQVPDPVWTVFSNISMQTAGRPFGWRLHISMMNCICMDIIYRNPEMGFRPDPPVIEAIPHFAPRHRILTIPLCRRAIVQPPECFTQNGQCSFCDYMVMVGQYAPGMDCESRIRCEQCQQLLFELFPPVFIGHYRNMVIICCGQQVDVRTFMKMWGRMQGKPIPFASTDNFCLLFFSQGPIVVH